MFIHRKTAVETIIIDTIANATETVHQTEEFAWGLIVFGSAINGNATVAFHVSDSESGTYTEIYRSGADVDVAVLADRAIQIPDEAMAANWIKVVPDSAVMTATIILKT